MWEKSESYLSDADNDPIPPEMYGMADCDHDMHNMTTWDKEDLAQQPHTKLRIVMMDCGGGLKDRVAKTEYSTLDQFQEKAVCRILAQHEYTDA